MPNQQLRQQQWQDILQLTGQLKQMSAEADWEGMTDIESKRQEMLEGYFEQTVTAEEAESIALDIQAIMSTNQQIVAQGLAKQSELLGTIKQFSSNREAIKAYHKIQK